MYLSRSDFLDERASCVGHCWAVSIEWWAAGGAASKWLADPHRCVSVWVCANFILAADFQAFIGFCICHLVLGYSQVPFGSSGPRCDEELS